MTVHANGAALAAVQGADGSWRQLALDAAGDATVDAEGPFAVAVVCDNDDFSYYTVYAGPGAGPLWMECGVPATLDLKLETASPSTRVWGRGFGELRNGSTVKIAPGPHDFVAIDDATNPPRFEIRRDVLLTTHTTISFDDLPATGTPMNTVAVDVSGAEPEDSIARIVWLRTPDMNAYYYTFAAIDSSLPVFPSDALVDTDVQIVGASVSNPAGDGTRSASLRIAGDELNLDLALPPPLPAVTATFDNEVTAAWENDHDWTNTWFYIYNTTDEALSGAAVEESYVAAGGSPNPVRIPDPRQIPGWNPAWTLPSSAGTSWSFGASRSDEIYETSATRTGSF